MPPHPIDASYCHLVESGLENLERMEQDSASIDLIRNELWHLRSVNRILTDYLLYHPHDARWTDTEHGDYWDNVRAKYMLASDPVSIDNFYTAWECLALATRGHEFYDQIKTEEEEHRRSLPS